MPLEIVRSTLPFNPNELFGGFVKWRYWSGGLIVSVLIHLVVFWPEPYARNVRIKATPLSVRFVPIVAPEPAVRSVCCEAHSLQSSDLPVSSDTSRSSQQGAAEVRRGRRITTVQQGWPAVSPIAVENAMPASRATEQVRQRLNDEGPASGVSLASFRLSLAAAAVRMQTYPQAAMAAGLEGTVLVDVRLDGKSVRPLITVGRSSGVEELDREAVQLLARAVMTLPVWQASMAEAAAIRLPVSFELKTP